MTLKPEDDLDVLKMYLYTENETLSTPNGRRDSIANEKNTKIALKVKGQGQMSPSSKCF